MSAELTLSAEDRIMLVEIATCTMNQNSTTSRTIWEDELDFEPLCIVITAKPDTAVRERAQVLANTYCFNDNKARAAKRSMRHYKSDGVRRDQYIEDHVRIVRVRELERGDLGDYPDVTMLIEPKEKVRTVR